MRERDLPPDAIVERRRVEVAREWRELKGAIRSDTGLTAGTLAWVVGLAGVGLGLELARRWLRRR